MKNLIIILYLLSLPAGAQMHGFLSKILTTPDQYEKDTQAHDFLMEETLAQISFKEPKTGPQIKSIVLRYKLLEKDKYKKMIQKKIQDRFDSSVRYGQKINFSIGDENFYILGAENKILSPQLISQIELSREKGFFDMVSAYSKDYQKNTEVHEHIVREWLRLEPQDFNKARLTELILNYKLCGQEQFKEKLTGVNEYKKAIQEAVTHQAAPAFRRSNESWDVERLELAYKCGALTKQELSQYYFLTYLYGLPLGSNQKPNALFYQSIAWMKKLSGTDKEALIKFAQENKLTNFFKGYTQLPENQAQEFMNLMPGLKL